MWATSLSLSEQNRSLCVTWSMKLTRTGYMLCQCNMWTYSETSGETQRKEVHSVTNRFTQRRCFFWCPDVSFVEVSGVLQSILYRPWLYSMLYTINAHTLKKDKEEDCTSDTIYIFKAHGHKMSIWNWIDPRSFPGSICAIRQSLQCLVVTHKALQTQRQRTNRFGTDKWERDPLMEKLVHIQRRPIIEVQPSKFCACDAGCFSGVLWGWGLYNEQVIK